MVMICHILFNAWILLLDTFSYPTKKNLKCGFRPLYPIAECALLPENSKAGQSKSAEGWHAHHSDPNKSH